MLMLLRLNLIFRKFFAFFFVHICFYPESLHNGAVWQFGKLNLDIFTQNKTFYTIQDLDQLFAAVNYVFQQCELQLDN
jgi:hypothetical protein